MSEHEPKPVAYRYEVQHGPEGEASYAWLYKGDEMIATMKTHHASDITALQEEVGRLKRELEDADALIKAQQHDFAANNIRNAEDAARANAAEQRLTAVEHSVRVGADVDHQRDFLAMEARRYASHYPEASDGRNTFIMFAEMIEDRAALKEAGE